MPKDYQAKLMYNGSFEKYAYIRFSYCTVKENSPCLDLSNQTNLDYLLNKSKGGI